MGAKEIKEEISLKIAHQMEEADPSGWVIPWYGGAGLPKNAATGAAYRGGNIWALMLACFGEDTYSHDWATYKQWITLGRQVNRGELSTKGLKYGVIQDKNKKPGELSANERGYLSGFSLFNYAQTSPIDDALEVWEPESAKTGEANSVEACESYLAKTGALVNRNAPNAFYSDSDDTVNLPPIELFKTTQGYYATLFHELTHWTGSPTRLARECAAKYHQDKKERAKEELIAELGAALLCGLLGIEQEPRLDHAQYLKSWISLLKTDTNAFWSAASAASKAIDYLDTKQAIDTLAKV